MGAALVWLLTRKPRESVDAASVQTASIDVAGIGFALTAGVLGAAGLFFYLRAVARENVAVVASVTALYPLVAALLGRFVLGESLSPKQLAGMALALVAVVLLGGDSAH